MRNLIIGVVIGAVAVNYTTGNIKIEINLGAKGNPTS